MAAIGHEGYDSHDDADEASIAAIADSSHHRDARSRTESRERGPKPTQGNAPRPNPQRTSMTNAEATYRATTQDARTPNTRAPASSREASPGGPKGDDLTKRFIDFNRLMSMNHLEARQAWPADRSLSAVGQQFVTRPIDKQHNVWAADSCLHCANFLNTDGAHAPLRCQRLRSFLASKPSLRCVLVTEFPGPNTTPNRR